VVAICAAPHWRIVLYQWLAGVKGSVYVNLPVPSRPLKMRGKPRIAGIPSTEQANERR